MMSREVAIRQVLDGGRFNDYVIHSICCENWSVLIISVVVSGLMTLRRE
jgi:hypothetical protein